MYLIGLVLSVAVLGGMVLLVVLAVWATLSAAGIGVDPVRRGARRARRHGSPAVCGVCGHPVGAQISGARCSECGTLYLHGGIVTTATTTRLGVPLSVATVLLLLVCLLIGAFTVNVGVTLGNGIAAGRGALVQITGNQAYRSAGAQSWSPSSSNPGYHEFWIDFDIIGPDRQLTGSSNIEPTVTPQRGTLTLGIRGGNVAPASLIYDIGAEAWSIPPRGQVSGASGNDVESAVRELYRRSGLDVQRPNGSYEIADAILIANTLAGEGATAAGVPSIDFEIHADPRGLASMGGGWGSSPANMALVGEPAVIAGMVGGLIFPFVILIAVAWFVLRTRHRAFAIVRGDTKTPA